MTKNEIPNATEADERRHLSYVTERIHDEAMKWKQKGQWNGIVEELRSRTAG